MKESRQVVVSVALRVGTFTFFAIAGEFLFGILLWQLMGPRILPVSTLAVFSTAAVANALAMRIWEHGNLLQVGFAWNSGAIRNLALGLAGGIGAAAIVLFGPVLEGAAEMVKSPEAAGAGGVVLLLVMLVFGAIGEEMLFHGYGFQVLMRVLGPFATILPVSIIFALAHGGNLNVSTLGLVNTGLWGVVLGFAFWLAGDLWLPIGLHLGWNWMLPLAGANLSGFTMSVMGYTMRWRAGYERWSGGAYGPEGSPLTTAILVLLFVWLWLKAPISRHVPPLLRERWDEIGPDPSAKE